MKILFAFTLFFFICLTANAQFYLSPILGLKKSNHPNFRDYHRTDRNDTYKYIGIRSTLRVKGKYDFTLEIGRSNYIIPIWEGSIFPEEVCACGVTSKSINYNLGFQAPLPFIKSLYYMAELNLNQLSDLTIVVINQEGEINENLSGSWSRKENGNNASIYNGNIGLGYIFTKLNIFAELNYSRSIAIKAIEKENFTNTSSLNLLIGYKIKLFSFAKTKEDCPEF